MTFLVQASKDVRSSLRLRALMATLFTFAQQKKPRERSHKAKMNMNKKTLNVKFDELNCHTSFYLFGRQFD